MTEAEVDALKMLSKTTGMVEYPMTMEMGEGSLKTRNIYQWEGDSVITFAVVEVEKKIRKRQQKR